MGKKSDKMYISRSEWQTDFGCVKVGAKPLARGSLFKRLPFSCCALSLLPFETPVCSPAGTVYDLLAIVPWIARHASDPVSGAPLAASDLVRLSFTRSPDDPDAFICPVTFKTLTDNSHIVAIRTSGNVYAYEAVDSLNIRTKNWKDLLSGVPFTRADIITLQDPHNIAARNINDFHHVRNDLKVDPDQATLAARSLVSHKINTSGSTGRVLDEMAAKTKAKEAAAAAAASASAAGASAAKPPPALTPSFVTKESKAFGTAAFSKGLASSSFTSTATARVLKNEAAVLADDELVIIKVKGKAAVTIRTSLGDLAFELLCEVAPRACYNFIQLAKQGYYKGVVFHRLIAGFMVQGGDPTGTGRGGDSIWKRPFRDEVKAGLSHSTRGILSMANRGPDTNTSQFFVTLGACKHLDGKHTIFGTLVSGQPVLAAIEAVPVNAKDRPKTDITILDVDVTVDPFDAMITDLATKSQRDADDAARRAAERRRKETLAAAAMATTSADQGVGKYLDLALGKRKRDAAGGSGAGSGAGAAGDNATDAVHSLPPPQPSKKKTPSKGFGDFSGW
ncbi:hypothetical protein BC831DRAFT_397802 [Entophlyctis helioformis]|nr:hypothetical protein BC831DRAFT_397802 [Entophlyctis helioformis]